MRVWDVSPGYLNRQSLLGEHRELHGIHSILGHQKRGYARHPETLRWTDCLPALGRRHAQLVAEMRLRGYADRTPIVETARGVRWPSVFVTAPAEQIALLIRKYRGREAGRIRLPRSAQELWAQHKYSVMARDPAVCRAIGRRVTRLPRGARLGPLADELVLILRADPPPGRLIDALEHMWGHVSNEADAGDRQAARASAAGLFLATTTLAVRVREPYLMSSTALSDLALFVPAATARL